MTIISATTARFNSLPVYGELSGDDTCTCSGLTVRANAPVLAMCRQLLAVGLDPDTAMEVYRGAILALKVRSIGEAARLDVNSKGTGFVAYRGVRTAPPIAPNDCPATLMAEPVE
jgi:hypothetical protein